MFFSSPVQERLRSRCYLICWNRPGFTCVHHPLDLVLAPGMALGPVFIGRVHLTHLPSPPSSKSVLVIHPSHPPGIGGSHSRCHQSTFRLALPLVTFSLLWGRERDLWILSFLLNHLSLSLPPSPSSSILFPQHSYLRMDLQITETTIFHQMA